MPDTPSSLMVLIQESRQWASVSRGLELFTRASEALQRAFAVDSGYFIYKKTGLWERIEDEACRLYAPWGVMVAHQGGYPAEEDRQGVAAVEGFEDRTGCWIRTADAPEPIRQQWQSWGIKVGGAWRLTLGTKPVGLMVLRRSVPVADDAELMGMVAGQVSLVMELLRFRRTAEEAGWRDELTGIYNRRGIERQMALVTQQGTQTLGTAWIFGIFDINRFKYINDAYGHPEGDRVLADVAKALCAGLRPQDICGRWGGDEFVVLVNTAQAQASTVIARLQELVAARVERVTVSAGWAVWGVDGNDLDTIYDVADQRLYEDKKRH